MKKVIFMGVLGLFLLGSCNSKSGNSHEGHNHEHEGHDHEHETAEEHAGHNHESKATKHSDEIIFPKAQAAKTTFEVREIQPASFCN